jgi:hypothetical protein
MKVFNIASKSYACTSGKDIQTGILNELHGAQSSIFAAVAWFTDQDLLDMLLAKTALGLDVKLVIADNEENQKLNFESLIDAGAELKRVKGNGFGMMHQKYCVIDEKLAITGSYNWTNNAKSNNSENAVFSTENGVIKPLLDNFKVLLSGNLNQDSEDSVGINAAIVSNGPQRKALNEDEQDFIDYLNDITAELTDNFDPSAIEGQARELAMKTAGNPETYTAGLDQILNEYRISLSVDEEKKRRCINLLNIAWESRESELESEFEEILSSKKQGNQNDLEGLADKQNQKRSEIHNLEKEAIKSGELLHEEKEHLTVLLEESDDLKDNLIVLPFTFRKTWYYFGALGLLLAYLYMFYSSAIYTLLNAEKEAEMAVMIGQGIPNVAIFNPLAFFSILDGGGPFIIWTSTFFVALLGANLSFTYLKKGIGQFVLGWLVAVFLIDFILAISISQTIHKVNYLAGKTLDTWHFSDLVYDINFWLVFVFGAIPLVVFKLIAKYLYKRYQEGNTDIVFSENKYALKRLAEKMAVIKTTINEFRTNQLLADNELLKKQSELDALNKEKNELIKINEEKIVLLKQILRRKHERNKRIYLVFSTNIFSSSFQISQKRIIARIACYLKGWHLYLSEIYSQQEMGRRLESISAHETEWLNNNFSE